MKANADLSYSRFPINEVHTDFWPFPYSQIRCSQIRCSLFPFTINASFTSQLKML